MERYIQKRVREQQRMMPRAMPISENARYYDCAVEECKIQPSLQMVRHNAMKCWEGYERVPGTKAGSDDSCRKKGSGGKKKKKDKKKSDKKKAAKKDGDASSSASSSSSDDEDGKKKQKKGKEPEKGSRD